MNANIPADRERLRGDVNAGIEQLQRGEALDGDEVFQRLERRIDEIGRQKDRD